MGNKHSDIQEPTGGIQYRKEEHESYRGFLSDRPTSKSLSSREQSERLAQLSQRYKLNNTTSHALTVGSRSILIILEGCTTVSIPLPDGNFTSTWLKNQFLRRCRDLGRETEGNIKIRRIPVSGKCLQKSFDRLATFLTKQRNLAVGARGHASTGVP